MSVRVASLVASLVLGACSFSPTGGFQADDVPPHDADGDATVADAAVDAPIDSSPIVDAPTDACTDVCNPQTGVITSCGGTVTVCPAGCTSMDSPSGTGVHCKQLVPSNGVGVGDLEGADMDLTLTAGMTYTFNTDNGEIRVFPTPPTGGGTVVRAAGPNLDGASHIRFRTTAAAPNTPGLGVWGFSRLTIPGNTVVRPIAPSGGRAAVLLARGAITVAGTIDLGAGRTQNSAGTASPLTPGPGGFRGAFDNNNTAQGCAPGGPGFGGTGSETGGGGGGLGTAGGKGGPQDNMNDNGGTATPMGMLATACLQPNLQPLRGGSGGGMGGTNGGNGADGGGGGGAIQLSSLSSIALASARVFAGGAGGAGTATDVGGGGGGAGGAILIEAPAITIEGGFVTAGGGGGGGGNGGAAGQNARDDGTAAMGGGNGGRGATGTDAANNEVTAANGTGNVDGTGGGGGGAGIIHLRSISPAVVAGGAVIRPRAGSSTAEAQ